MSMKDNKESEEFVDVQIYNEDSSEYKLLEKYTEWLIDYLIYSPFGDPILKIVDNQTVLLAIRQSKKLDFNKLLQSKKFEFKTKFLNTFILSEVKNLEDLE